MCILIGIHTLEMKHYIHYIFSEIVDPLATDTVFLPLEGFDYIYTSFQMSYKLFNEFHFHRFQFCRS